MDYTKSNFVVLVALACAACLAVFSRLYTLPYFLKLMERFSGFRLQRNFHGLDEKDFDATLWCVAALMAIITALRDNVIPSMSTWSAGSLMIAVFLLGLVGILTCFAIFSRKFEKEYNKMIDRTVEFAAYVGSVALNAPRIAAREVRWQARRSQQPFYAAGSSNSTSALRSVSIRPNAQSGRQRGASPASRSASGAKSSDDDGGGAGEPPGPRQKQKHKKLARHALLFGGVQS